MEERITARAVPLDESGLPKCKNPDIDNETPTRERNREDRNGPVMAAFKARSVNLTRAAPTAGEPDPHCEGLRKLEDIPR